MKKLFLVWLVIISAILLLSSCVPLTPDVPDGGGAGDEQFHIHEFEEWSVLVNATCTENGEKVRYCSCGERQTEYIPSYGHTEIIDEAVEPTCTETGLTEGKHCGVCNEAIVAQEKLAKLAHSYDDIYDESCNECDFIREAECEHINVTTIPAKEANCTEDGYTESKVCDKCEEIIVAQEVIPAGHIEEVDEAIEPTCTETGLTEGKHCGVCNEVIIAQATVNSKGHSFEKRICLICGEKDYSEGLNFATYYDGTCYVSGIGTCNDTHIIVPPVSPEGKKVTGIEAKAFYSCTSLVSIEIPDSVTSIGDYAFSDCTSLVSIEIPDSVTSIGDYAFSDCTSLVSIELPDSVTIIGWYAFSSCTSLVSIEIPDGVTTIGQGTFFGCFSLSSVVIGDEVTTIGPKAFYLCHSLVSVVIPSKVEFINYLAFSQCNSLTSVEIGESVRCIDTEAFSPCGDLVEVINKSSLDITAGSNDHGAVACNAIEVHSGETKIVYQDEYLFYTYEGINYLVGYVGDKTDNLVFPKNYYGQNYEIYTGFGGSIWMESIEILGNVTSICEWVFTSCDNLMDVVISNSVTSIGDYAFYACYSLRDVYYTGSETEWAEIAIGSNNTWLTNAKIHYNYIP